MTLSKISLVILASGMSHRFGASDKLLSNFQGRPLGAWSADVMADADLCERVAVVPKASPERRALFEDTGWTVIVNPKPTNGQARSLECAVTHVAASSANALIFCLADMPFIRETHLRGLIAASEGQQAVMCDTGAALTPPAFFERETFPALMTLNGDRGAKSIFHSLKRTATFAISPRDARDIDTPDDLTTYSREAASHG